MAHSEKLVVRSPDEQGRRLIEELTYDILSDLDVTRSLHDIKIFVDPNEPVFILYGRLAVSLPSIKMSDVATMTHTDDGLRLDIKNERYANNLLERLIEQYGKADILQLDRYTILVATDEDVPDDVIYEPAKELKRKIIDAIRRIAPEGYRIIKHEITNEYILFIASEEPIKESWMREGQKLIEGGDRC